LPSLEACLSGWAPEAARSTDQLLPERARALAAVLETPPELRDFTALPPLWHWVYFHQWPDHSALGADGHPANEHFLPPIPDRRRMFAGGRLLVDRPLQLGVPAERTSALLRTSVKQGRTGELAFVTVRSEYRQHGQLCLTEEQDHVYRSGDGSPRDFGDRPAHHPRSDAPWQQRFTGDPVRLFRFSALTANSHRIHYDLAYCQQVEHYPDLVVHGPLLVLLMTELARQHAPQPVTSVDYRFRRPVFAGDPVLIAGGPDGKFSVRTEPDNAAATAELGFGQ